MSASPPKSDRPNPATAASGAFSLKPKPERGATIPHGSKDHEIDNLKRLLADVSKRLDKLK